MAKLRIRWLRWIQRRIERTLAKRRAQGNDTILFMYKLLIKELENNGYDVTGGASTRVFLTIFQHFDTVEISNNNGWKVRGAVDSGNK